VPAQNITAPTADAAQFDSEALWALVARRIVPGARVLIVRGADAGAGAQGAGRDWFARQVAAAGGTVDLVASYQRLRPVLDAAQSARARAAAQDGSVWLFSSSEAISNLQASLPQQDWGAARAVATHARIAQAARAAGFAVVRESRPALADVRASIESMQ
jgi:uroporphyrinogen-III synthase